MDPKEKETRDKLHNRIYYSILKTYDQLRTVYTAHKEQTENSGPEDARSQLIKTKEDREFMEFLRRS